MKQVEVTDDFLGLDESDIGCHKDKTYNECITKQYVGSIVENCECLPFSMIITKKVLFQSEGIFF